MCSYRHQWYFECVKTGTIYQWYFGCVKAGINGNLNVTYAHRFLFPRRMVRYHQHLHEILDLNQSAVEWLMQCFPDIKGLDSEMTLRTCWMIPMILLHDIDK